VLDEIEIANHEMNRNGIVAVGDISNDDHSLQTKSSSSLYYHTFVEAYGFKPENAEQYFTATKNVFQKAIELKLSAAITPHAPYSVPKELMQLIYGWNKNHPDVFSIHNQETEAETQFFQDGTGDFKKLIDDFFKMNSAEVFHPTGKRSIDYLLQFLPKEKNALFVHNTFTTAEELKNTSEDFPNVFWCACPKANLYIENRLPDYNNWLQVKDKVCVGTDSLASNDSLSILEEIKTIQKNFPELKTEMLINWATINGAKFLQIDEKFGSIEIGKTPGLNHLMNLNAADSFTEKTEVNKIS
ncbi:MAG: amidohydrolase family protein, partial [Bacteroidota bacterium]